VIRKWSLSSTKESKLAAKNPNDSPKSSKAAAKESKTEANNTNHQANSTSPPSDYQGMQFQKEGEEM
jgi:hypothetical protein